MKSMKNVMFIGVAATLMTMTSCSNRKDNPPPAYYNVPDGGTAVIDNTDLSNKGLLVNRSTTTWVLKGNVTMDDLSINGKVVIEPGANVLVRNSVTIGGGSRFQINGSLTTNVLKQIGNSFVNGGNVTVTGEYNIGGGTITYLQNSRVAVNKLVIVGAIAALENDATKNGNIYSVIYFIGNNAYLNRGGGTSVCGPVLFTYNGDMGGSGVKMDNVSENALSTKPDLKTIYQLPDNSIFYQYADQNCTPQNIATGF